MGHRWQGSPTAELMGSLEGWTETEAGVEGPESSWVRLRGEALPSKACSLTPDPVGRHALGSPGSLLLGSSWWDMVLLGLPRWPRGSRAAARNRCGPSPQELTF